MKETKGDLRARGRRFAIVASRFNEIVVAKLLEGALDCLRGHGAAEDDLHVVWVPGAFELPTAARLLAGTGSYDAVICLGAIIRGETPHHRYVARRAAEGIGRVADDTGVSVIFGVLTADTLEQATERAGGSHGNRGWYAATAAMEMASLVEELRKGEEA